MNWPIWPKRRKAPISPKTPKLLRRSSTIPMNIAVWVLYAAGNRHLGLYSQPCPGWRYQGKTGWRLGSAWKSLPEKLLGLLVVLDSIWFSFHEHDYNLKPSLSYTLNSSTFVWNATILKKILAPKKLLTNTIKWNIMSLRFDNWFYVSLIETLTVALFK